MRRGTDDEGSRREIRIMGRMKKMAEETRKEMEVVEVVEAMKKQLRLRGKLDHFG